MVLIYTMGWNRSKLLKSLRKKRKGEEIMRDTSVKVMKERLFFKKRQESSIIYPEVNYILIFTDS